MRLSRTSNRENITPAFGRIDLQGWPAFIASILLDDFDGQLARYCFAMTGFIHNDAH